MRKFSRRKRSEEPPRRRVAGQGQRRAQKPFTISTLPTPTTPLLGLPGRSESADRAAIARFLGQNAWLSVQFLTIRDDWVALTRISGFWPII
jgi:hypothetical protein